MLLPRLSAIVLAAAGAANAFKDASPFLLFSSESLSDDLARSQQLARVADVERSAYEYISSCKWDHHIIQTRPGLKAADYQELPLLRRRLAVLQSTHRYEVSETIGGDLASLAERAAEKCAGKPGEGVQYQPAAEALSTAATRRRRQLEATDLSIDSLLSAIEAKGESYIVMLAGVPEAQSNVEDRQHPPYEMDEPYPTGLHTDLKRDLTTNANDSSNAQASLPLFEKYKFLSPAIFMGLVVTILLGSILYVGITAIAGLEVSYFAFSKEMGSQGQAQRNKQQ
ncbi:hypothetical protein LTR78_010034 [Recurvomyces mirabilis]|uniref:Protein BIG1 n=1 Tax=Recurvomyces mirabilis TaxID=574656 RepID=A0AAE0TMY3_9PEZI|nr:hypothetical protein LTR78_010034 [Recurvomyces mirabilis]KAK5149815.1 hypothetical protein LTS14_010636 [Recurvomyces mirabilis]